jgi:hypothetical protein
MATYSFTCLHCHQEAQSPAQNARFCSKKECQKARKDMNRKQYKDRQATEEKPIEQAKAKPVEKAIEVPKVVQEKKIAPTVTIDTAGSITIQTPKQIQVKSPSIQMESGTSNEKKLTKKKSPQKSKLIDLSTLSGPGIERVDDNIIIIRTHSYHRPTQDTEKK